MSDSEFITEFGMLLSIYLWKIENYATDASGAYHDLRNVNGTNLIEHKLRERVWVSVEAFLKDTSMLSKALFPSSKKSFAQKRGQALLGLLGLKADQLTSLQSRKLRNRIEHFDEDFDCWWTKKHRAHENLSTFAIKAIDGLDDDIIYAPNANLAFMYNPSTGVLHHLDQEFEFHSIFEDVLRVAEKLKSARERLQSLSVSIAIRESR